MEGLLGGKFDRVCECDNVIEADELIFVVAVRILNVADAVRDFFESEAELLCDFVRVL